MVIKKVAVHFLRYLASKDERNIMMACNGEEDFYSKCPLEGQGELTEEFLEELGRELDNEKQFRGSWREFGSLLLNCRTIDLDVSAIIICIV